MRVLVGDIVLMDVVSYVVEVLGSHITDRNLMDTDTQLSHQFDSVMIGAVVGAKTRHGDTYHLAAVVAQTVSCQCADQQCEGGVQSA